MIWRIPTGVPGGNPLLAASGKRWGGLALRELLQTVLPREHGFERRQVEHVFPDLGPRRLHLSARRIAEQPRDGELVLLAIENVEPGQG